MSDIFIKTGSQGNTGWRKMSNLFVKTTSQGIAGWKSAIGVWIRQSTQWLRVWPLSGVFATRQAWVGANSDTTYENKMPYSASPAIRIGSNYYGNNAIWDANGWTISSYTYAWKYYTYSDASDTGTTFPGESGTGSGWTAGGTGQDALPLATWNSSTNNTTYDRKYLRFEVTANATSSTYSGLSKSSIIQIVRRIPINLSISLNSTTPTVGTSISLSSSWDTSEARKPEAARTKVKWYRNSVNSATGGILVQDSDASSPYSYTPTSSDIGNYIYAIEETFNSGTDFDNNSTSIGVQASVISANTVAAANVQATGQQRRVNLPSNFTSGTNVYVSTNGYIGLGTDPSGSIFPGTTGRYLMPLQGDQRQTALWTYADSSNFYVRWQGARYNDAAQTIDYQAKFYWNSTAVDVYFVTNNLSSSNPASTTAIYNDGVAVTLWSASTAQSSSLISTSSMTRNTSQDGVDDNRTLITASIPSAPTGGSASLTNASGTAISTITSSGIIYLTKVDATGSPTPTSSIAWQRNDGGIGGNQFRTVQDGGSSYTTGSADVNYSIRAVVTWTNGISPDQVVNTGSVSVTAGSRTVTWNAAVNGGTGGGSTTENAGVAHTAPSASKNSFLVSYNGNSNTSGSAPSASQATYVFNGYYDTASADFGYGPIAIGGSFTPPSNITMYGRWSTSSNSITLASAGTLARTNYTFGGWNTNTSGTGTNYNAGDSYTPSAAVTLYAKWVPDTYTISYNKNTTDTVGSLPSSQTKTYNVTLTLSSNTPTRTGYTFSGWNTQSNGGGDSYSAGGSYTANAAATLYAQWTAAPSVPGNPSGGSISASTLTRTMYTNLTRITNTAKDQDWEAEVRSDFTISWTGGSGATSHEIYYNTTGSSPTSATGANYGSISTNSYSDYWFYGSSSITYYYWVRARNANGTSDWHLCGSKTIPALSVSSFSIRIYAGDGSTFSSPSNPPSSTSTTGSYSWTGLTSRGNPNANPPTGIGHYAWARGTINGTVTTGTSSAV